MVEKKEEPPEKKEPVIDKKETIDKLPDDRPSGERREAGRLLAPLPAQPAALLRRVDGPWQRVKPDEKVQTSEKLMSLPGYRSKVLLTSGVELTLAGQLPEFAGRFDVLESSVVMHAPPAGFDADLTLDRGRVILANVKNQGEAKVRLRLAGEIWDLNLTDNQTALGAELGSFYPPEVPFRAQPGASDGPLVFVNAYGLKGHTELKVRYETFGLAAAKIFQWNNRYGPAPGPSDFPTPPWFQDAAPATSPIAKDLRAALNDLDKRLDQKPVEVAILEMRKEAKPAPKLLAIARSAPSTLSAT